ncbi:hypothetical protein [Frondihabitans cladoniiphilus]|uniref:Uncharacterized protein n=1 Tax=Frondihabitans cladoniiphilus TaxID=715785 RepID=A0ABP8WEZ0_9MICO
MTQKYPARIHLTEPAERYIDQLGTDLILGNVELHQLPPSLLQFHVIAFNEGRASLSGATDTIERLEFECDRLYAEVCRRIPPKEPTGEPGWHTFAQWQKIRADMAAEAGGQFTGGSLVETWVAA